MKVVPLVCAGLLACSLPACAQLFAPEDGKERSEAASEAVDGLVLESGVVPKIEARFVGVVPTLVSGNLSRTREFYTRTLGFDVVLSEGKNYIAFGRDTIRIGLALNPSMTPANRSSVYINVSGIDALYDELKKRGVKMTKDIATQPSKMREFTVLDPDNNSLMFGEYLGR